MKPLIDIKPEELTRGVDQYGVEKARRMLHDWIAEVDAAWVKQEAPHYDEPWQVPPFPGRLRLGELWSAEMLRRGLHHEVKL